MVTKRRTRVHRYLVLSLVLCGHLGVAQECPAPQPVTPVVVHITSAELPEASLKARLITLLRDSLMDQGRGKVDLVRETQIRKLMKELERSSPYDAHGTHRNDGLDDSRTARGDSTARSNGHP